MDNITYCPFEVGITEEERLLFLKKIKTITNWEWDSFRSIHYHILENWNSSVRDKIESFLGKNEDRRYIILKTLPWREMSVHTDTSHVTENILKFKYLIQGNPSDLYLLDKDEKKVYPNKDCRSYILDSIHPHALKNNTNKNRYLLLSTWNETETFHSNIEKIPKNEIITISKPKIKKEWIEYK